MSGKKRKYTLYQSGINRNIILTDDNPTDTSEEIKAKLIKLLASKKICVIQTQDDLLVFRPKDISAILVSSKGEFEVITNHDVEKSNDTEIEANDFISQLEEQVGEADSHNSYEESLTFNKDDAKS